MSTRGLRRVIQEEMGSSLRQATVKAVHGDSVSVQVGGSPKYLRGLSVVGGVDNVVTGDTVLLLEADGQIYAEATKSKAGIRYGNKSGASVGAVMGPHAHLAASSGGVLASYVRVDDVDTITAQHSFSPPSAQAPFLLGGHAQSQVVVGLRADQLNKNVNTGSYLTGGGALTSSLTLDVDLAAAFAWTADHSWDADTLFVDVSEDGVYINSGTLPTIRGALTVQPATTTQRGLVLKRPWAASSYNANLLAIIDENNDALIVLTKAGDLESGSPGFVSGQTGWQMTYDGNLECNNAFIRGELHATTFVADEMHATGGTLAVMTASKVGCPIDSGDNILANVGQPLMLVVQASWDTGLCYVADTHVLRIKSMAEIAAGGSLDLWDIWLEVTAAPSFNNDRDLANGEPGTYDCVCVLRQGGENGLVIPTGAAAVHWGTIGTGRGGLILTSDLNYSPYMDIFTIPAATPWSSGTTPHVRVGNLDGILSLGEEWGIAAGEDLSDAAKPHIVMSDQRLRLWGVAQRWWDTSGNTRGEIDPSAGDADVLFWLGPSEAGAHFKVLGSGDVWLDTLAISGDLGDFLFSKADGLLLLGPNCGINDAEWWSLRKQKALIFGAFHQEAGRWLGTRGLLIEKGVTNYVNDPSGQGSGWPVSGGATITHNDGGPSNSGPWIGSGCVKLVTVAATQYSGTRTSDVVLVAGSTTHDISFRAWCPTGNTLQWRVQSWGYVTLASGNVTGNSQWQTVTATFTSDATLTHRIAVWTPDTSQGSFTFYLDGVQVEQRVCATTYCDGNQGHEYTWSGTEHASTSIRATTQVNLDALSPLISGKNTLSFRAVVQMLYDADATWPEPIYNYFLDCYDSGTGDRIFGFYDPAIDKFRLNYGTAYMNSGVQVFKAGDWVDMVITLDYTADDYNMYLNGVLAVNETTACSARTISEWNLGSRYSNTGQSGYNFSEFAAFGKVLSAAEVSVMYALQRPLVDAGSLDTPGIYILDGAFKMASSMTGNRIEMDAEEIAGYDSGGTKQFYLRASDGKGAFAGGDITLGAAGAVFKTNAMDLTFENSPYNKCAWGADSTGPGIVAYEYVSGWKGLFSSNWNSGNPLYFNLDPNNLATKAILRSLAPLEVYAQGGQLCLLAGGGTSVRIRGYTGNIEMGLYDGSFGGGVGVIFVANATTIPSSNPTSGGILYVQSGALKYRGSSGTVTTIANA